MFQESGYQSELTQNVANASMSFLMYSAVFGNMNSQIMPASPGKIQAGFPSVSAPSLKSLLYNQQMSNPAISPSNIRSGSTAGTQNIQGGQTVTDSNGDVRISMGTTGGF